MKITCPICKWPLYLPEQPQEGEEMGCRHCHSSFAMTHTHVVESWAVTTQHQIPSAYLAILFIREEKTHRVQLDRDIPPGLNCIALTPLHGLGKHQPILLLDLQTAGAYPLTHPRRLSRRYQLQGALLIAAIAAGIGLELKLPQDLITGMGATSSLLSAYGIARFNHGNERDPKRRTQLLQAQGLLKQSHQLGERIRGLEQELSQSQSLSQQLQALSRRPTVVGQSRETILQRGHKVIEGKNAVLQRLIDCCRNSKDLIDVELMAAQLNEQLPDAIDQQLLEYQSEIEKLEEEYEGMLLTTV